MQAPFNKALRLLIAAVLLLTATVAVAPRSANAQTGGLLAVTATTDASTHTITLSWLPDLSSPNAAISRRVLGAVNFIALGNQTSPGTFVDSTAAPGTIYEYKIASGGFNTIISAGINIPVVESRGTVELIVDNTYLADTAFSGRVARLKSDLIGDGWKVVEHDVARDQGIDQAGVKIDHGAGVVATKTLIYNDHNTDPTVKAVFLLGHVPVPYTGTLLAPDNHTPYHQGAWPCDAYYGDMADDPSDDLTATFGSTTSKWTDANPTNYSVSTDPRNFNVAGDGKFDQNTLPDTITLEVGRVDMADMPDIAVSEETLLENYLDKDHDYRQAFNWPNTEARREAIVGDGGVTNNFFSFFGATPPGTATVGDPTPSFDTYYNTDSLDLISAVLGEIVYLPLANDLSGGSFLWAYGNGGVNQYQAIFDQSQFDSTADFNNGVNKPGSVFYALNGDWFPDFDSPSSLLKAPLATPTYGLTSCASGDSYLFNGDAANPQYTLNNLTHWSFDTMDMGIEIGYSALQQQNKSSQTWIALMGDPTLRLHVVAPPSGVSTALSATVNGAVDVTWTPSTSQVLEGYDIYRADLDSSGNIVLPFVKLNSSVIPDPSLSSNPGSGLPTITYTDAAPSANRAIYMVRTQRLQTSYSKYFERASDNSYLTPAGTYRNLSQGAFGVYDPATAAPVARLIAPITSDNRIVNVDTTGDDPTDVGLVSPTDFNGTPLNITMLVDAAAPAGQKITSVDFYENRTLIGTATPPTTTITTDSGSASYPLTLPYSFTLNSVVPGHYTLYAVANCDNGRTVTTNSALVTVYAYGDAQANGYGYLNDFHQDYAQDIFTTALRSNYSQGGNTTLVQMNVESATLTPAGDPGLSMSLREAGDVSWLRCSTTDLSIYAGATLNFYVLSASPVLIAAPSDFSNFYETVSTGGGWQGFSIPLTRGSLDNEQRQTNWEGIKFISTATPQSVIVGDIHIVQDSVTRNRGPQIRIVSPTGPVTGTPPIAATLVGNAESSDGTVQELDFYDTIGGATTLVGVSHGPYSPFSFSFSISQPGVHTVTAVAIDTLGHKTVGPATTYNVTVPPTVTITAPVDQTIFDVGQTVPVTATATVDPTTTVGNIQFLVDGVAYGTPVTTSPYTINVTGLAAGNHTINATITDGNGIVRTGTAITVRISTDPTVSLTAVSSNGKNESPALIDLSATAAVQLGTITQVAFYVDSGDGSGPQLIGQPVTTAPFVATYPISTAGTYVFTARATDSQGFLVTSAPQSVQITAGPSITLTSPTDGQAFVVPAPIPLLVTTSDPSAAIAKVVYYANGTAIATVTTAPFSFTYNGASAGTYALTAVATDANGVMATSNTATITVTNPLPTVAITAPADGSTVIAPGPIYITATATAPFGTIAKVDFYNGATLLGTATAPSIGSTYSFKWNNVAASATPYAITAVATTNLGASATSNAVNVSVIDPTAQITLVSPTANAVYVAPATVALKAFANISFGSVAKVEFYQGSTLIGTATTPSAPNTYSFTWTGVNIGSYSLTAKAYDSFGGTATSTAVPITVNPAPATVYGLITRGFDGKAVGNTTVTLTSTTSGTPYTATTSAATATGADNKSINFSLPNVAPDTYAVTVTNSGYTSPTVGNITVAAGTPQRVDAALGALHAYSAGLQMLSTPYDFSSSGQTLSATLGDLASPKLAVWLPQSQSYAITPTAPADNLRIGQGYWARFPATANLVGPHTSAPATRPFTIGLHAGWNMIGCPFLSSVTIGNLTLTDSSGATYTLAQAASAPADLANPSLYTLSAGASSYTVKGVGDTLDPWQGYWIQVFRDCTLSVPPPAGS